MRMGLTPSTERTNPARSNASGISPIAGVGVSFDRKDLYGRKVAEGAATGDRRPDPQNLAGYAGLDEEARVLDLDHVDRLLHHWQLDLDGGGGRIGRRFPRS